MLRGVHTDVGQCGPLELMSYTLGKYKTLKPRWSIGVELNHRRTKSRVSSAVGFICKIYYT